jgi:putative transposon-encoded protein
MIKIRKESVRKGSKIKKKKTASGKSKKRIELSSRELRVNLEQLQKDAKKAYDSMMKVVPEAIKNVEIKRFGNASHIILPKSYAGKKATVVLKK